MRFSVIRSTGGVVLFLPQSSRRVARRGLELYQPVSRRARAMWLAARFMAGAGILRITTPSRELPPEFVELLGTVAQPADVIAVAIPRSPDRFLFETYDRAGQPTVFGKVWTGVPETSPLPREAEWLQFAGRNLEEPVRVPSVLEATAQHLLLEPVAWRIRSRPWRLAPEVARALGSFFALSSCTEAGPTHGDLAPWNLLETRDGWYLVDWERASPLGPPFHDLLHFLRSSSMLLGRPRARAIPGGLEGRGWIGRALREYCRGARLDPADVAVWWRSSRTVSPGLPERDPWHTSRGKSRA
jgi:hypothetical protein